MRVGIDIETTGLSFREGELVAVTIAYPDGSVRVYPAADALPPLQAVWEAELVCHNATFDLVWLCRHFGLPIPRAVFCTLTAEKLRWSGLWDEGGERQVDLSLAATVERELGVKLDKELQTSFTAGSPLTPDQVRYAARDAAVLLPLAARQEVALRELGLERIWELEKLAFPVFLQMMVEGIPFDREHLATLVAVKEEEAAALRRVVVERLGPAAQTVKARKFRSDLQAFQAWERELEEVRKTAEQALSTDPASAPFPVDDWLLAHPKSYVRRWEQWWRESNPRPPKPVEPSPFNPDSVDQLRSAFAELGWEVDSVAEEKLLVAITDPAARETYVDPLLRYRRLQKQITAFGRGWLALVEDDGRLHPEFQPVGTASGRPTSRNPNLLQLPADPLFRSLVRAPEGYAVVAADYSQMELRLMAELSGDPEMVGAFQRGDDLHWVTAKKIFGEGATKQERSVAKTTNFLILYGGGAQTLAEKLAAEGILLTPEEAKRIVGEWRATFPVAWAAIEAWREEGVRRRQVASAWGRIRRFAPDDHPEVVKRAAGNHVIQATNADITKLAMVGADAVLRPLGGRLLLQVYDELVALVPEEVAELAAGRLRTVMVEAAKTVLRQVPVEADVAWGASWAVKG